MTSVPSFDATHANACVANKYYGTPFKMLFILFIALFTTSDPCLAWKEGDVYMINDDDTIQYNTTVMINDDDTIQYTTIQYNCLLFHAQLQVPRTRERNA